MKTNEFGFPHVDSWHPYDNHGAAIGFGIGIAVTVMFLMFITIGWHWCIRFVCLPIAFLYLWATPPQNYRMKRPK